MEVEDLGQHISRRFNEDLEKVRSAVLNMGGLVEAQFDNAIKALADGDSELGLQVAQDDYKINRMEVNIDEHCSRILATRAPAASDLRLIIAIIKTITDLERIGDEAEKIGVLASRLAGVERPSTNYRELRNLASHVKQMLSNTLDAFARLDAQEALKVVKADDIVDEEYESIYRQGVTFMMEDPRTISRVMDTTWTARSLERIGDHCKNICEYVMFMVYGKDIRYTTLESIEAQFAPGELRGQKQDSEAPS
jgi:phosphate transport system protein